MNRRGFLFFSAVSLAGCTEPPSVPVGRVTVPKPSEPVEAMFGVAIDASGSYLEHALLAFKHFSASKDLFFREATGARSRIVISQISATTNGVIYDGAPRAFSEQFGSPESFQTFLASKVNPAASRVYLSLAETVEWFNRQHAQNDGMKSAIVVYSDMVDTHGGKERLLAALKVYSQYQGSVWLYWVQDDQAWETILSECGIVPHVEPKFRADPPLPQF